MYYFTAENGNWLRKINYRNPQDSGASSDRKSSST